MLVPRSVTLKIPPPLPVELFPLTLLRVSVMWPAFAMPPPLARKSHRTKARLGGYSERRVCSVVSMPAGGASRREECWNHFALPAQRRSGLGGPWDDAARTTRCGGACQAGEPRALAAAARRRATCPQTSAAGQADAIPTLIRRTLNFTKAPILSNLRRMVPQVALAKCV